MFRPSIRAILATLARDAFRVAIRTARLMLPGMLAIVIAIGLLASVTYETSYTDSSGARCYSFRVSTNREADMCTGLFDRSGLGMPPTFSVDASIGGDQ